MRPGLATGCAPGNFDDCVQVFDKADLGDGSGARLTVQMASGYGNRFIGLISDRQLRNIVYIGEGERRVYTVPYDATFTEHVVGIEDLGGWSEASGVDVTVSQQDFMSDKARSLRISWDAYIEVLEAYGDAQQLSAFVLTGLRRYATGRATDRATQLQLDVTITTSGADHTVALSLNDLVLAAGTLVGAAVGDVTLAEVNNSGLSGTVHLSYTADIALGACTLNARWAQKYEIHCATSLNFPRTPEAIVFDPGLSNRLSAKVGPFAPGTYVYVIRAVSDTATTGTNTVAQGSKVIPGRPEAPGMAAYLSGGYAATVIKFTKSATLGATYRYYGSALNGPIDWATPLTVSAVDNGDGTVSATLPSISAAAGVRRVSVASVNGGIEDGLRQVREIEYDAAGTVILPRPNVPGFVFESVSGRTLTVRYTYSSANQKAAPTTVELYLVSETGSLSGSPDATAAIKSTGTISASANANGWYRFLVRTLAASGSRSNNVTLLGPTWLSNVAPAAPANVDAELVV